MKAVLDASQKLMVSLWLSNSEAHVHDKEYNVGQLYPVVLTIVLFHTFIALDPVVNNGLRGSIENLWV